MFHYNLKTQLSTINTYRKQIHLNVLEYETKKIYSVTFSLKKMIIKKN